jgi:hydrogenase maturation protease
VVEHEREPSGLIDLWAGAGLAIVIDAVRGRDPGAIHRIEAIGDGLPPTSAGASSHALGLDQVVELARAVGRLPARLVVFGIEGKRFDAGAGLSPVVRAAVADAAELVVEEIGGGA